MALARRACPPPLPSAAIASSRSARSRTPRARLEVDANGLAVAPGFINMLSWADEPLLVDGRSQSDIRQGVTLEVFGEGWSMGPLNARMKQEQVDGQGDLKYAVDVDDARRVSRGAAAERHLAEHRVVCRRDDGSHSRGRLRRIASRRPKNSRA